MNIEHVRQAAQLLAKSEDEALEVLLGKLDKAVTEDPSKKDDLSLNPQYDGPTMGTIEAVRDLGRRVARRWSRELHGLVCGEESNHPEERGELLDALKLSEAATIAAVASGLVALNVGAAIAAAAAPLIVRRFIWPAKDELCTAWAEMLQSDR